MSMSFSWLKRGVAAVALSVVGTTAGFASGLHGSGASVDMGSLRAIAGDQTMTVTLPLSLSDPAGAEEMMRRVATPGDALFHRFLTPAQIRTSFGPSENDVARVTSVLLLSGLSVERTTGTTLKVTGLTSTMERLFQTELHQFQAPASETSPSITFHAPAVKPTVPASIANTVQGVLGLDDAPHFSPHVKAANALGSVAADPAVNTASTGTPFGKLTVTDFAKLYDVEPVYAQGISGAGRTIAVVTLAGFTPSDAFAYWNSLGLTTNPNRITIIDVDGGPSAADTAGGGIETSLDVEQSGGIAPGANIIVYEAPNTNQAFIDVFAKAVEDNIADSMSTSFGEWEFFNTIQGGGEVTDDLDGEMVSSLQAMHELFVLGALQGQSLFAAAGDCGAFDSFDEVDPGFTTPLSVDYPGDDPAITSAGGTTLPGTLSLTAKNGTTTTNVTITIPQERVWGWDYLEPLCDAEGTPDVIDCGIFPTGTGGGASVFFTVPLTQIGLPGIVLSQPGQQLVNDNTSPPTDVFNLPADFPGRNVPDVEFNADPETGYEVFITGRRGLRIETGFGGTSFVGPQLNGVTALLGQNAGGQRFGLLTVPLYALARTGLSTLGPDPVFHNITAGDNWFFSAHAGFSPAGGLGTIQVSNLARILK
jgi:subtilase family serine protease